MRIKYKTRKGQVIDVRYDSYDLQEGEHWVTTKDNNGVNHSYVIGADGEVKTGYYKGVDLGESGFKEQKVADYPIGQKVALKDGKTATKVGKNKWKVGMQWLPDIYVEKHMGTEPKEEPPQKKEETPQKKEEPPKFKTVGDFQKALNEGKYEEVVKQFNKGHIETEFNGIQRYFTKTKDGWKICDKYGLNEKQLDDKKVAELLKIMNGGHIAGNKFTPIPPTIKAINEALANGDFKALTLGDNYTIEHEGNKYTKDNGKYYKNGEEINEKAAVKEMSDAFGKGSKINEMLKLPSKGIEDYLNKTLEDGDFTIKGEKNTITFNGYGWDITNTSSGNVVKQVNTKELAEYLEKRQSEGKTFSLERGTHKPLSPAEKKKQEEEKQKAELEQKITNVKNAESIDDFKKAINELPDNSTITTKGFTLVKQNGNVTLYKGEKKTTAWAGFKKTIGGMKYQEGVYIPTKGNNAKVPFTEKYAESQTLKVMGEIPFRSTEWFNSYASARGMNKALEKLPVGTVVKAGAKEWTKMKNGGWKDANGKTVVSVVPDKILKVGDWNFECHHDNQCKEIKDVHYFDHSGEYSATELKNYLEANGTKVTLEEAKKYKKLVEKYTNGYNSAIFEYEAQGVDWDGSYKDLCDTVTKFIDIAPKAQGVLYRYTKVHRSELAKYLRGEEFTLGGISSFSNSEHRARAFFQHPNGMEASVEFITNSGTHYATPIEMLSEHPSEHESIMHPKARFRATKVETEMHSGQIYYKVYVEDVDKFE